MSFFNKGANDKGQNKGPADKFPSDKAKKDYDAGYKWKEKEQQKKK